VLQLEASVHAVEDAPNNGEDVRTLLVEFRRRVCSEVAVVVVAKQFIFVSNEAEEGRTAKVKYRQVKFVPSVFLREFVDGLVVVHRLRNV